MTNAKIVKCQIALKLASAGIGGFADAAKRLRISRCYLSNIVAGRRRTARLQKALARLCRCEPADIFGEYLHDDLKAGRRSA